MRKILICAALAVLASPAQAIDMAVGPGLDVANRNLQAETDIRKRYEQFAAAFNRHDAAAMAAMFTRRGDLIEPDGMAAEGREAVQKHFESEHTTAFKDATIELNIGTVWMITPNVGLVNGTYQVTGIRDLKGAEVPPRRGQLTSVMVKDGDTWWVAASRASIPIPVPWRATPQ